MAHLGTEPTSSMCFENPCLAVEFPDCKVQQPWEETLRPGIFALAHATPVGLKWEFPKIRDTLFGGPHNKDDSILGSILRSLYFGKLPNRSRGDTC